MNNLNPLRISLFSRDNQMERYEVKEPHLKGLLYHHQTTFSVPLL